MGEIDLLNLAF